MINPGTILNHATIEAAKQHAKNVFPNESCGIVFRGEYVPCDNIAGDPTVDFEIDPKIYAKYASKGGVEAVIHSHPNGPLFPTASDMFHQIGTNVPWGIIAIDKEDDIFRVSDPIMWGDGLPKSPLVGRQFVHGIHDCYSLIRDTFALGKDALAEQGITTKWPYEARNLPEVPRDDAWWSDGKDLYVDGLAKNGFRIIQPHEARAGDGLLMKIRSDKLNHGGVLVTDDIILHHLPMRASRREPVGVWGRKADLWVRHEVNE